MKMISSINRHLHEVLSVKGDRESKHRQRHNRPRTCQMTWNWEMAAVEKWKKSIITRVTSWHRWTKSLLNQILWFKFLFPRFPCPGSFQKMHNISKRHIKLTKAYQIEPAKPRKAKLNFELIDDWVGKLKKAGQLNPLWLVGLVVPLAIFYFLRVCLLSIPAVENSSTKVGNTPNSIFFFIYI